MSLNAAAVVLPGEGHFYKAPTGTAKPTGTGVPPAPWEEVGHTTYDDPLAINREGGDVTPLPSWQSGGSPLRTRIEPVTYGLAYNLLQHDATTWPLYYGGGTFDVDANEFQVPKTPAAQEHAIFVRIVDGDDVWTRYYPAVETIGSDSEELSPEELASLPVTSTVVDPGSSLDYLFSIAGPSTADPVVTTVTPDSGAAAGGDEVVITGTGFAEASCVTFDAVEATTFEVDSDTQITATTPAGSAGVVDVVVTNDSGVSVGTAQFTYV